MSVLPPECVHTFAITVISELGWVRLGLVGHDWARLGLAGWIEVEAKTSAAGGRERRGDKLGLGTDPT